MSLPGPMAAPSAGGSAKGDDDEWCVLSDPEIAPVTVLEDHWDSSSSSGEEEDEQVDGADDQVEEATASIEQMLVNDQHGEAWRYSLAVGQLIDALDTDKKWYESRVVDMDTESVKVHYRGWTAKWDEWLPRSSPRLAPRHTRVRNWRDFAVNDQVQVGFTVPNKSYPEWWNARVLAVEKDSGAGVAARIHVKVDEHKELWMDAQDDLLCAPQTHPSRNSSPPPPAQTDASSTGSESDKSTDQSSLTVCQKAARVIQASYGAQWDPKDVVDAINVVMDQASAEIFLVMAPGKHRDMWLRAWVDKKRTAVMP